MITTYTHEQLFTQQSLCLQYKRLQDVLRADWILNHIITLGNLLFSPLQTMMKCLSSQQSHLQVQLWILSPSPLWPVQPRESQSACRGPPPARPRRPSPFGLSTPGGAQMVALTPSPKWNTELTGRLLKIKALPYGKTRMSSTRRFHHGAAWSLRRRWTYKPGSHSEGRWGESVQVFCRFCKTWLRSTKE